jgi:hypothetical protein
VVGREQMEAYPAVRDELTSAQSKLWEEGAYPTRELVDFATTCVNMYLRRDSHPARAPLHCC